MLLLSEPLPFPFPLSSLVMVAAIKSKTSEWRMKATEKRLRQTSDASEKASPDTKQQCSERVIINSLENSKCDQYNLILNSLCAIEARYSNNLLQI